MVHVDLPPLGKRPAVFLDRDGVIVEETFYLADPEQVRLIPGAAAAIARVNAAGLAVVVVTNQAGVARGMYSESAVEVVHRRMDELLAAAGAKIDRYYYCPHHPTAGQGPYRQDCCCRKPRPGMLRQAAAELGLALERSVLIGDKLSDLEAGLAAGCRSVLVLTGYGQEHVAKPEFKRLRSAVAVAATLCEAIDRYVLGDPACTGSVD